MKEELVSIITPMYKGAAFIGETIRSVQAQTYSDWEMIIVDDCSPDGGAGIAEVKRYAEKDKRIKLIASPVNKGSCGGGILLSWIQMIFGLLLSWSLN